MSPHLTQALRVAAGLTLFWGAVATLAWAAIDLLSRPIPGYPGAF